MKGNAKGIPIINANVTDNAKDDVKLNACTNEIFNAHTPREDAKVNGNVTINGYSIVNGCSKTIKGKFISR